MLDCCDGSDEADEFGNTPCPNTCMSQTANPLFFSDVINSSYDEEDHIKEYKIWRSLYERKYVIRKMAEITVDVNSIEINRSNLESLY